MTNTISAAATGLPASTTRRRALASLAGLGAAASLPKVARATAAPAADPLLVELAQTYAATWDHLMVTMEAFNEASDRLCYPLDPDALFRQASDHPTIGCLALPQIGTGRVWYGSAKTIDNLRNWEVAWARDGTHEDIARRQTEILASYDEWKTARKAAEDAAGYTEANAAYVAALEADDVIRLRIANYESTDPACLRLKLRAFADSVGPADIAVAIQFGASRHGPSEDELALSIARDLCAVYGINA